MKRYIEEDLRRWKDTKNRKPLLVVGARQVGKTYSLLKFIKNNFDNYLRLDLLLNKDDYDLIENSQNIENFLRKIKLLHNFEIDENSILFIDEIQESQRALNFLKAINENKNIIKNVVCSGSWIENTIINRGFTFPVGQIEQIIMYPLSFFEFLESINLKNIVNLIKETFNKKNQLSSLIHEKIWDIFKKYIVIGGMPYIVEKYVKDRNYLISEEINIDKNLLISQYKSDLTKYTTGIQSLKINKIFDCIPNNLAKDYNRFTYSSINKNAKAREYEKHILLLTLSRVAIPIYHIARPQSSLKMSQNPNIFKLYFLDTGLLCSLSNIFYKDIVKWNFSQKGYLIENFIATILHQKNNGLSYWRQGNDYEVDFIIKKEENIIPIEVKSGRYKKSKSLDQYISKYSPIYSYIFANQDFEWNKTKNIIPIYAIELIV